MLARMDLTDFAASLKRLAADDEFTGSVEVTRHGETIFSAAHGYATRTWAVPTTLTTRYDTASITKLFTTVATLQQIERGAFALDTSVIDYLGGRPGLDGTTISPEITPHHLLTHTSGIADDADNLPNFAHKPPVFAPGAGCRYNNAGFLLLGLMVEKATGRRYRDYVTEEVFGPAGMTHAGFFRMDEVEPDIAEAVEPIREDGRPDGRVVGWRRNIYAYPPIGDSAGGAHVTVGDLLAFHAAVRGGRLVGPALTAALLRPHARHGEARGLTHMMGYGFEFDLAADGTIVRYGKEGVNVGTSGFLRHYPGPDVTLAILGVGEDAVWEPVRVLDAALRPG
jgi:CubicO group peptidase (beta-lactamase class C family)